MTSRADVRVARGGLLRARRVRNTPLICDRARVTHGAVLSRRLGPLIIALALGHASARAQQPAPLAVSWQSTDAAACPKPEGVEAEVARAAGSEARGEGVSFVVRVAALGEGRQQLGVARAGEATMRTRVLDSCAEAREAAVLIMAMALDPSAAESAASPAEPAAPEESAREDGEAANTQRQAWYAQGEAARWSLSLGALLDVGTLPNVGVGPRLGAAFAYQIFRLGASVRYLPARSADGLPEGVAVKLDSFAAGVSSAALFRFASTALGPRLELELGYLRGRPSGVEEPRAERTPWGAFLAGAELEVWFPHRLGLQLYVLAGPPLTRPRFAFEDSSPFYTTGPVVVRTLAALFVRLGATD